MRLFLIAFFGIYGSLHLYAFLKVRAALHPGVIWGTAIALFMALMVVAPVLVRILENQDYELAARGLSYVGYAWLGLLFYFICTNAALDVWRITIRIVELATRADLARFIPAQKLSFYACIVITLVACAYGYVEAKNIRTPSVVIRTDKLPQGIERLRIVQISDVHLGLIVRRERLKMILDKVRALKPDMLVATGDLVDGQINELSGLSEMLQQINPRYGKFAITGNHEYYAGLNQALEFTRRAGFRVLRGEAWEGPITVAGVDDPTDNRYSEKGPTPEQKVLGGLSRERFVLLLKHRPEVSPKSEGLFDLQLSGHSHGGQLFPFHFLVKLSYPLFRGFHELNPNGNLYISRGTGTWGPPVRVFAPPEVTLIELVRK